MRSLPRAPAHLVREAREGASWATEICIASSTSRVLPSLASQARRPPHVRRAEAMDGIQYATYYNRAIAMQITVPVGRKTAPSSSGIGQYREPSAWQRAEQTLMDNNWYGFTVTWLVKGACARLAMPQSLCARTTCGRAQSATLPFVMCATVRASIRRACASTHVALASSHAMGLVGLLYTTVGVARSDVYHSDSLMLYTLDLSLCITHYECKIMSFSV